MYLQTTVRQSVREVWLQPIVQASSSILVRNHSEAHSSSVAEEVSSIGNLQVMQIHYSLLYDMIRRQNPVGCHRRIEIAVKHIFLPEECLEGFRFNFARTSRLIKLNFISKHLKIALLVEQWYSSCVSCARFEPDARITSNPTLKYGTAWSTVS